MEARNPSPTPLRSEFADDADMLELIECFVSELDDRITGFEACLNEHRLGDLRFMAHQLKGAAGGYGYPDLSRCAGAIESHLNSDPSGADMSTLTRSVSELVEVCRRAISGHTPRP